MNMITTWRKKEPKEHLLMLLSSAHEVGDRLTVGRIDTILNEDASELARKRAIKELYSCTAFQYEWLEHLYKRSHTSPVRVAVLLLTKPAAMRFDPQLLRART